MQFDLDEDRALLKQSTRELLEAESPLAESRLLMEDSAEGYSKALYKSLAELGYLGLAVPDEDGGTGVGWVGLAAVLEEMGRVAFPGPFLDLVIAAEALRSCAGDVAGEWLRKLIAGNAVVILAERETLSGEEPATPGTHFADGRVTGIKHFVAFGRQADALLVTTDAGVVLVPRPDAGWNAQSLEALDHAQRFAAIELDAPGTLIADLSASAPVLETCRRLSAFGASALMLGLVERSLEMAVSYTMERQAFGAPLASFQALQHREADMFLETEATRAAVYRAGWAADASPGEAPLLVAVAKVQAGEAGRKVCGENIQLHGGVGYTWEYDPHIYYKRIKTLEHFYGPVRDQLDAVLDARGI
jgi:alkylation response protein AidB-like acyl-CoA dehydrogenase